VDYLLRAMPLLSQELPVHLHVVGQGNMTERWKRLAGELGLGDTVTFHGPVSSEALARHYAAADVFVLPAIIDERGDTEGLGVVLVEALTFQTPVVASDVGGIGDVIQHERTGLLVPEKDPAALARAIARVLRDRQLAAALAEGGLKHANVYFDWGQITRRLLGIYGEVAYARA
jgi:glycosyltransferase involved in cell wall biosynthesis